MSRQGSYQWESNQKMTKESIKRLPLTLTLSPRRGDSGRSPRDFGTDATVKDMNKMHVVRIKRVIAVFRT
jgi:hypothetical protein